MATVVAGPDAPSATPAVTGGDAVASPTPAATAAPAAPAATATPVDPVRVQDAERQSARFAEEAQDTEGDGDEALTQQLRDAQYAYSDAVAAGSRGDAAGFASAMQRADGLARAAIARLEADN